MSEKSFPPPIGKWTLETVRRLINDYPKEIDWFDFKRQLSQSAGKVASAFANTDGGYVVFGVSEDGEGEERIVGVPSDKDFPKLLGDQLKAVEPNIRYPSPHPIRHTDGTYVWVLHVPESKAGPHMFESKFPKRTTGGDSPPMDVYEVRDAMTTSAEKLARLRLLVLAFMEAASTFVLMRTDARSAVYGFRRVDTASLRLLIGESSSLLSPELLRSLLRTCSAGDSLNRRCDWLVNAVSNGQVAGRAGAYNSYVEFGNTGDSLRCVLDHLKESVPAWFGDEFDTRFGDLTVNLAP